MKKLKKQRGFTLVEMLIVVAIIAILVAVSIPLFTNSLERAKRATDAANERAAKAAAVSLILEAQYNNGTAPDGTYFYHADIGELKDEDTFSGSTGYGQCESHKGASIQVVFTTANGKTTYTMTWVGGTSTKLHGTDTSADPTT